MVECECNVLYCLEHINQQCRHLTLSRPDHKLILLIVYSQLYTTTSFLDTDFIILQNITHVGFLIHIIRKRRRIHIILIQRLVHILVDILFGGIENTVLGAENIVAEIVETQKLYLLWDLFALTIVYWEGFYQLPALLLSDVHLHVFLHELLELDC